MDMCESEQVPRAKEAVQPETVRLHPEADAILAVHGDSMSDIRKKFLVSSAVLSVASDYFKALLRSDFKEGLETRRGDCPTILMGEDDPEAMEIILSLLHYQKFEVYDRLDPETLAAVALHSDKYDCTRALRPWTLQWFRNVTGTSNADELGFFLVAAYFFHSSEHFKEISARAVRQAKADLESVWAEHDMITLLPQEIKGAAQRTKSLPARRLTLSDALTARVSQILDKLHRELQSVEGRLRHQERGYEMGGRLCMSCGRRLPATAKQCRPCYNSTPQDEYCTNQTRIAEYFAVLRRSGLWPSLGPFQKCTISELANRFSRAKDDQQHQCSAGVDCPLRRALEGLSESVDQIVKDIRGVSLDLGSTSPYGEPIGGGDVLPLALE
jgi:hypothetical protein